MKEAKADDAELFKPTYRMFAVRGKADGSLRYVLEARSREEAQRRSLCIAGMLGLSGSFLAEPCEVVNWSNGVPVFLDAYFAEAVVWVPPRERLH